LPSNPDDFLFTDTFTAADWKESIAEGERRSDTISRVGSACRLTIICDFAKYKSAIKFILGYSWVDENFYLRRFTPQFHPVFPWLYARAITNIEFAKFTVETNDEGDGLQIARSTLHWTNAVPFAVYDFAKITIEFCEVRYDVLTDNETELQSNPTFGYQEWTRYVERIPQSYVDLAHIDGGQLAAFAPTVGSPINGSPFISAPYILARQEKSAWKLIWREVPEEFLYDGNGFSQKLAGIQKRVNSVTFMGRAPGTLLCESAIGEKNPAPVATDQQEGLSFTYDVTLEMKEFDPQPGDPNVKATVIAAGTGSDGTPLYGPAAGWNLLPGVRGGTNPGGNQAWAYYYYTANGTATGKPQFEAVDFFKIFSHWSINTFT